MIFRTLAATIAGAVLAASIALPALAQEPTRAITKIVGDVYRFQNQFHYSVFGVTDDGIVFADPLNPDASTWVKAEITKRFG